MSSVELAQDIRRLRARLRWTQARMADELATDLGTVSRWERGVSRPRKSALRRLVDLGLDGRRRFARYPVAVAMAMFDHHDRLLLLDAPKRHSLEIPSGAVEDDETLIDAVRREMDEEVGPDCMWRPVGIVHAYTITHPPDIALVSVVHLLAYEGGAVVPGDDMAGATIRWTEKHELHRIRERINVPSEPWILDRAFSIWAREKAATTARRP